MATRNDVTVRVDTDLRDKAREFGINMSRLLEDAIRDEIERRDTIKATLSDGVEEIKISLEDPDGRLYIGKFTGRLLGGNDHVDVYLDVDGRVLVHDINRNAYQDLAASNATVYDWLGDDPGVLAEVLHALGETPEIDI